MKLIAKKSFLNPRAIALILAALRMVNELAKRLLTVGSAEADPSGNSRSVGSFLPRVIMESGSASRARVEYLVHAIRSAELWKGDAPEWKQWLKSE